MRQIGRSPTLLYRRDRTPRPSAGSGILVAMNTPPNPGIPAALLLVAAKFGWIEVIPARAGRAALGVFMDGLVRHPLRLRGGAGTSCEWMLDVAPDLVPYLVAKEVAEMLQRGEAREDALVVDGVAYQVQAVWDGDRPVAMAVRA
jgi:hypothetical protein